LRIPKLLAPNLRGAAVFGTSIVRTGEITAKNGVIQQSNFNDYPVARINEAPRQTNVYLVESSAPPAGVGEPGVPAVRGCVSATLSTPPPASASGICRSLRAGYSDNRALMDWEEK